MINDESVASIVATSQISKLRFAFNVSKTEVLRWLKFCKGVSFQWGISYSCGPLTRQPLLEVLGRHLERVDASPLFLSIVQRNEDKDGAGGNLSQMDGAGSNLGMACVPMASKPIVTTDNLNLLPGITTTSTTPLEGASWTGKRFLR